MDDDRRDAMLAGIREGRPERPGAPGSRTRVISIASGKGGVGKSSVTTNTAVALARLGHDTAVVDADVWGFSIPRMLGIEDPPAAIGDHDHRPGSPRGAGDVDGLLRADATGRSSGGGRCCTRRSSSSSTMSIWDEPEFLLIDMPPGTGDVAISLSQFLPRSQAVVVTTPQPTAQRVARRAALMAAEVEQEVIGVVENMSWFTGDDGTRYPIFGEGGGAELAAGPGRAAARDGAAAAGDAGGCRSGRAGGDRRSRFGGRRRLRGDRREDRRGHGPGCGATRNLVIS